MGLPAIEVLLNLLPHELAISPLQSPTHDGDTKISQSPNLLENLQPISNHMLHLDLHLWTEDDSGLLQIHTLSRHLIVGLHRRCEVPRIAQ